MDICHESHETLSRFDKQADLNINCRGNSTNVGEYVNLQGTREMFARELFCQRRERLR